MRSLLALALLAGAARAQTATPRAPSTLTIDQLIQIRHPSGHQWTPDGRHVWFTYDDGAAPRWMRLPAREHPRRAPLGHPVRVRLGDRALIA